MPELPAHENTENSAPAGANTSERLATPAELAEFGGVGTDPETESKILALLEVQMAEVAEPESTKSPEPSTPILVMEIAPRAEPTAAVVGAPASPTASVEVSPATADGTAASAIPEYVPLIGEKDFGAAPVVAGGNSDLLEIAEALDQHRLWVESKGAEGVRGDFSGADLSGADLTAVNLQGAALQKTNLRGADLAMANLRGADLAEADLRETNLLGAEFSGANLMGANLYGAQGLWAGRLGGTNLFDATLPEAVSAHDGGKTIGQSTQAARWFYMLVIALCLGAIALIALTTDVRLLLDESATVTARIPNLLPLQGFYLGAPLLLTVLYLRLQFLLLRLWGSIGALPAVFPDGQTPEKDGSWYLMGPIRTHLKWSRDPRSPLAIMESLMARLLVYWGVPGTLLLFWVRYLVLQDYRGTLLHLFLFTVAAAAACAGPRIVARVLRPGDWIDESTANFTRDVLSTLRLPVLTGVALFVLSLGVIKGLPADPSVRQEVERGDYRRWAATVFQSVGFRPYADISEEIVSTLPVKNSPTDPGPNEANGPRLNEINLRYARGYRAAFANARMWRANLEGASLSEADFRGANLREAVLRSAKLDRMQAIKANMVSVDARWAEFSGADFRNADFSFANLEGAALPTANFARATLYSVNLRRTNLLRADLSHADLRDAKLEDATLSLAQMEQTDLSSAKLMGVNFTGAQFKGTILLEADLSRADLRGANLAGAILRQARLDGARLDGADLRGALGLEAWQICGAQGWRGAQMDADIRQSVEQACGTAPVATSSK